MDPTVRIVEAVIRESDPHRLDPWESGLRNRFAGFVLARGAPGGGSETTAESILRELNWRYRTRYPLDQIDDACQIVVEELEDRKWWHHRPAPLLQCGKEESRAIADAIPHILGRIGERGYRRPYSLLTKFLYFCFPECLPIYDAQVASSIQMWSYMAYRTRGEEWQQFAIARTGDTSGQGYVAIVRFYRHLWNVASDSQRARLKALAVQAEATLGARVTVLDLIDKLLWRAAGDPLRLGLRCEAWLTLPVLTDA